MGPYVEIDRIKKSDRYNFWERITDLGGPGWRRRQEDVIALIETGRNRFFVSVGGRRADVIVSRSQHGNKYLKTVADAEMPNNLLSLPEM